MPDFTMCQDPVCPRRGECRRHAASGTMPSDQRQPYFTASPLQPDLRCTWHMPTATATRAKKWRDDQP